MQTDVPAEVRMTDLLGQGSGARRYGRFYVPAALAYQFSTELKRVMGLCTVLRAEYLMWCDQIEYHACSEHFRPIELGEMLPEYVWHFTTDGDLWCKEVKA